jgi:hypothetical protein
MSVDQNVIAIYGWITPTSGAVQRWAAKLDYDLPTGIRLIGMDSKEVAVGINLFDSGSPRWGPMDGDNASFNEEDSLYLLEDWGRTNQSLFSELFEEDIGDIAPQYHIFINHG